MGIFGTAHAIGALVSIDTERCKLKTPGIGGGITGATRPIHADPIKAITIIIIEAGHAADAAVARRHTKGRVDATACIIDGVTDHALIAEALAKTRVIALRIVYTGHALIAIITIDTDPKCAVAPTITA